MKIIIKKLNVEDLSVKNNGIEFGVNNSSGFLGDLIVAPSGITWCQGKTTQKNGTKITWKKLINLLEEENLSPKPEKS